MGPGATLSRAIRDQRVAYAFFGGLNTAVGLAVFVVLYALFEDQLHYLGALALAYVLLLPFGCFLQRRFVFKVEGTLVADFLRYSLVQSGAFALNIVILPAIVEVVGVPVVPAQVLSLATIVVLSFLAHSAFSFKRA